MKENAHTNAINNFCSDDLTVGIELEWADVDRRIAIPKQLGEWDYDDYTIVNSNGRANDPTGTYPIGGEINTRPTQTAQQQADIVAELRDLLQPTINYRCNLHVHVGIGALQHDLATLKTILRYITDAEPFVYEFVEKIPKPLRINYPNKEEFAGAMKRYRRRLVSHQQRIPANRVTKMLDAITIEEFFNNHAHRNEQTGRYAMHLAARAGINLRSLKKNGTIEFRHFAGTCDPIEIEAAVEWCRRFTWNAITNEQSVQDLYWEREWKMPTFRPYIHALEIGYQETKYR